MMDNKPRDYGYIDHKDHYPLQLKGTMKRMARPSTGSSSTKKNSPATITFGNNEIQRQKFLDRVTENYQDLKSVIPIELQPRKKQSRIKTYQKENYVGWTGATYLMIKSDSKPDHPERRHMDSRVHYSERKPEKQRKHFDNYQLQTNQQWQCSKPHNETLKHKINNDLYSNAQRRERAYSSHVRMSQRNMFTEGASLGFEAQKARRMSYAKQKQIIGQYCRPESHGRAQAVRDDWRRSSIILG